MGTVFWTERELDGLFGKKKKGESKYHAKQTEVDGIRFDSAGEARRYSELRLLERSGEIHDLRRQVPFVLIPTQREPSTVGPRGGVRVGKCIEQSVVYYADFVYRTRSGETVVEDTKGVRTEAYKIKRKLMLWIHGIRIREVVV